MRLLGLRVCAHDTNITYYDGEKLRYRSFERDFQFKHFGKFSRMGWIRVLDDWNVTPSEIDSIGIVMDESPVIEGETEIPLFRDVGFTCPIHRIEHHRAHVLSCWPLGVEANLHFVLDAFGDDYTYRSVFRDNERIDHAISKEIGSGILDTRTEDLTPEIIQEANKIPSLGFIMTRIGSYLGIDGHYLDQAGKIMAIKAFGRKDCPDVKYVDDIDRLNEVWDFGFLDHNINSLTSEYLWDYIATAHEYTERIYLNHFRKFVKDGDVIGYSGGIAQNTIINKVLRDNFPNIIIPPHANDQGLSLGCIEYLRRIYGLPEFDRSGFPFWQDDQSPKERPSDETIKKTAQILADGGIVGWYQGHGEVGPRALGNRSILMSPVVEGGKDYINEKVKHREPYRPFGASVLEEKVSQYFYWNGPSPYMLYVADVLEPDLFPAITHVDGTCRHQTVSKEHEDYYRLISEFEKLTGLPILLNTSLNNGGKPIAGRMADAFELYHTTNLDSLVVGDDLRSKP